MSTPNPILLCWHCHSYYRLYLLPGVRCVKCPLCHAILI